MSRQIETINIQPTKHEIFIEAKPSSAISRICKRSLLNHYLELIEGLAVAKPRGKMRIYYQGLKDMYTEYRAASNAMEYVLKECELGEWSHTPPEMDLFQLKETTKSLLPQPG